MNNLHLTNYELKGVLGQGGKCVVQQRGLYLT